jgi:hypothetical protein
MCKVACIPAPGEAMALAALYPKRMQTYQDATTGVQYIAPGLEGGRCVFQRGGLCQLHDKGRKPMQGRLACHDRPNDVLRAKMLEQWQKVRVPQPGEPLILEAA